MKKHLNISRNFIIIFLISYLIFNSYCAVFAEGKKEFSLKPTSLNIPINETRQLLLCNRPQGEVELNYDPNFVEIALSEDGKTLVVKGVKLGYTKLVVSINGKMQTANIFVKDWAGKIPQGLKVRVSGNPCPKDVIKEAILENLKQALELKDGTDLNIDWSKLSQVAKSYPGETHGLNMNVKVYGGNYFERQGNIYIQIDNQPFSKQKTTHLFVSNNPETIRRDGILFEKVFVDNSPHRLFYHHKNSEESPPRILYISLINDSMSPADIFITTATSGPTTMEIQAGHIAALKYFISHFSNTGWVLRLNPQSSCYIATQQMNKGETVGGIFQIWPISGMPPKIKISAVTIGGDYYIGKIPKDNLKHPEGIFKPADIGAEYSHIIGSNYTYIYIGNEPFLNEVEDSSPDYGNYGVLYDFKVTIENPYNETKKAMLYFVPGGGAAKAVVMIDGKIYDIPKAQHTQKVLISIYELGPLEKRELQIKTIPQGGSNYPVHLLLMSEFDKEKNR